MPDIRPLFAPCTTSFVCAVGESFFQYLADVVVRDRITKTESTNLSASRRSVQRACPSGASEQAKAVMRARASHDIRTGLPERGFYVKADLKPSD